MAQPTYRYQLVTLGPGAGKYATEHAALLRDGLVELGLDPDVHLRVLSGTDRHQLDGKGSIVGLWYGGVRPFADEDRHEEMLDTLLDLGATVLPLADDLANFGAHIPKRIGSINGLAWTDPRVTGDVLEAFGLTRRKRQAFISYKRSDSSCVARQMAHALFDRGYLVFLDTASAERGLPFQDVLKDRLADIDLVVLLDSPHALDSTWVHEELDMVHQLGLGVLQLYWTVPDPKNPGARKPEATKGTEFSFRFLLEEHHFVDPANTLGPTAALREDVLAKVADMAEQARIRSLGSRRNRVVSFLRAEVVRGGMEIVIEPGGPAQIVKDGQRLATAYPIMGLPDALVIDAYEEKISRGPENRETLQPGELGTHRLVYDGLGILEERLRHLSWLNGHLHLKTVRTEHLDEWLTKLP